MQQVTHDVLLTISEVLSITGYKSRSSLYRLMRQDKCPKPVAIGGNQIRWRSSEIESWLNNLPTRIY
ncbi:MAG: AlpA family phage regulatory protein [Pseudomonadota bacterium]|nr:AlpA family phage regulatory protein [Pseudomonadota bacterium]